MINQFHLLATLFLLIAGDQDRKTRLAPAMIFVPTLLGFSINLFFGLAAGMVSVFLYYFWNDEWSKVFGLSDALMFLTLVICSFDPFLFTLMMFINLVLVLELVLGGNLKRKIPLIWYYAKITLIIIFFLTILFFIQLLMR